MSDKEELYESLGELIYVVAKADGVVQDEEISALKKAIEDHPWASTIKWSFDFSRAKDASIDDTYRRVIDKCYNLGPLPEYSDFVEILALVANAHDGVSEEEGMVINSFATELLVRFRNDLNNISS